MKLDNYKDIEKCFNCLRGLIEELYVHEPCGGPLHIITDDGNVRDADITWCYRWLYEKKDEIPLFIFFLCRGILHDLALLEEAQRTIWWIERSIREEGLDPVELAVLARGCSVKPRHNGGYDDQVVRHIRAGEPPIVVWEGLEQLRERKKAQSG